MYEDYTPIIKEAEEGGFFAYLKELKGVLSQGETEEEAKANLKDAFDLMMDYNGNN